VEAVADGWDGDGDPLPVLRTQVSFEVPRSVISYNQSPDCRLTVDQPLSRV